MVVLAGWIVPRGLEEARRLVTEPASKLPGSRTELKGSSLLKSRRGETVAGEIIAGLLKLGCAPTYIIVEKKFAVCGKIVEAFLDPADNPRVSNAFVLEADKKTGLRRINPTIA